MVPSGIAVVVLSIGSVFSDVDEGEPSSCSLLRLSLCPTESPQDASSSIIRFMASSSLSSLGYVPALMACRIPSILRSRNS